MAEFKGVPLTDFELDSLIWRGRILTGKYAHWCYEYDYLPVDETCLEFQNCICYQEVIDERRKSS